MRFGDLFASDHRFRSEHEVKEFIRTSKNFNSSKEAPNDAGVMVLFETSKQKTWLVATSRRLYCILDDVRKEDLNINWSMRRDLIVSGGTLILPITARDKTESTGYIDIGPSHKNWLYTRSLFQSNDVVTEVRSLLERKMSSV